MGQMIFVAFEPREEGFIASVPIEHLESLGDHPEASLREASATYHHHLDAMRSLLDDIGWFKTNRIPIPARKMWDLGDSIFRLVDHLADLSLEIDGLYEHLSRDLKLHSGQLGMYRLTRAVTFRRYLPDRALIPDSLGWRVCEKNVRKTAEQLAARRKEPVHA